VCDLNLKSYLSVFYQLLVSGGVDSTVCAALLSKALSPDQVIALHIDNGFMRKDESHQVAESLRAIGLKLIGNWLWWFFFQQQRHNLFIVKPFKPF